MTFRDQQRRLNALARELARGAEDIVRLTGDDLLATAERYSSGTLKSKDLARMDHPYATRHGNPRLNPGFLNVDTGAFLRGWRLRVTRRDGGWQAVVVNTDPKGAQFLQRGTRRMFARPIDEQVMAQVKPRWEARWRYLFSRLRSL